jgi:N-acyl-phosphatidylethanolamine-hydrolysing phospholipase D
MDQTTLGFLGRSKKTKFFVPLGNKAWFESLGIERCAEMDWWDGVSLDEQGIKITCTPCQHFSGRGLFDRFKSLWSSWVVESVASDGETKARVYFAGDTGYRAVDKNPREYDEEYLDTLPHCPAFKEIGTRKGPFDLALIPIGAFSPRHLMSPVHCSPEDAVRVHEDIQSKRSIGMHWGTWVLTDEEVTEPPRRLKAAMENRGHDPKEFDVCKIGETVRVDIK